MSRIGRFLPALVALMLLMGVPTPASASEPVPSPVLLRLLLTGDSISQGFHGDYTYRYFLWRELRRQGVAADFVGSYDSPSVKSGYREASYARSDFDADHFAVGGSTVQQHATWVTQEAGVHQPGLVVFGAGTNDLRRGASAEVVAQRARDWIGAVRSAAPLVRIILSEVLPVPVFPSAVRQQMAAYNVSLRTLAAELTTPESPVVVADTARGWDPARHTYDGLHPTPYGDTLLAQRVGEALHAVAVLPERPNVHRWVSWDRRPVVGAVARGRRVELRWDAQAVTGARIAHRRVGGVQQFPATRHPGGRWVTPELVAGETYEFRVQLIRGTMATPLGPVTRVTLPLPPKPTPVERVRITRTGIAWSRSPDAVRYQVTYRRADGTRRSRVTRALSLDARRVRSATVVAVNEAGRSAPRSARR